jgi:hypothetical protein
MVLIIQFYSYNQAKQCTLLGKIMVPSKAIIWEGIRQYYGSRLYKSIYFIRQQTTWNEHLKCLIGTIKIHTKY